MLDSHARVRAPLLVGLRVIGDSGSVNAALAEITEADWKEPDYIFDPPGHGFVWDSRFFGRRMYLKCRLEGRKPVCVLYSLHPALYGGKDP